MHPDKEATPKKVTFTDEQIRLKAYLISQKCPEQSPDENWAAAIQALGKERSFRHWNAFWQWTGIGEKKGWDIVQLLITASIPLLIFLGTQYFTSQNNKQQREIARKNYEQQRQTAKDNANQATLVKYLEEMATLLDDGLLKVTEVSDEKFIIAQAKTVTVLQSLNPKRQNLVIQFLDAANLNNLTGKNRGLLYQARMSEANFYKSDLSTAKLRKSDLSGANLSDADLSSANLNDANLSDADLSSANLNDANLSDANLFGANFNGAYLSKSNLSSANLFGANFNGAYLSKSNLSGSKLFSFGEILIRNSGTTLHLISADFNGASLIEANLSNANLINAYFNGADLSKANLNGSNLSKANLSSTNLSSTNLSQASLIEANLSQASLIEANLRNANLISANLSDAVFARADLTRANLTRTNLSFANFINANLTRTNLNKAYLSSAILLNTDLRETKNLTKSQLEGKDQPLICNSPLPQNVKIDLNRDCENVANPLYKRFPFRFSSLDEAGEYVQEQRQKKWD